jgi:hypothetical protein
MHVDADANVLRARALERAMALRWMQRCWTAHYVRYAAHLIRA